MDKEKPDIAVIINSYNRLDLLKGCLNALSSWVGQSIFRHRLVGVVFDAGSSDGSLEWMESNKAGLSFQLEVICPKPGDDTSFAAGLNAGVAYAEKEFGSLRYLLFYETDNQIFEPTPLTQAIAQLEKRKNLGACGFTVRKHDGRPSGVGTPFPTLLNFALGKRVVGRLDLEAIPYRWEKDGRGTEFSEVDVVYTSPLVVKIEAWRESRGLNAERFPFSDCDIDWAFRLRQLGWRMGVIRTDAVVHDNLELLSAWSKSRDQQSHRGRLRYFLRYRPTAVHAVWPVVLLVRHSLEYAAALTVRNKTRRHQFMNQFSGLLKSCINKYE